MTAGWELGPFTKHDGPILDADPELSFSCPVAGRSCRWAAKDVFNPGAVVHDGRVHLLVRAEDDVGRYGGTSRIGLAVSDDGRHFELEPEPVIYPADDEWQPWEWPGGCEDPRVVEAPDGGFVCFYTAFDGKVGRLFVATSNDVRHWVKHGPAFGGTASALRGSKSAAPVTELRDGRLVATRIGGRHWLYWGEGIAWVATSEDLVHWEPVMFDPTADRYLTAKAKLPSAASGSASVDWAIHRVPGQAVPRPVLFPRPSRFDSLLVEPGPPAVRTDDGIVLIYNGANHPDRGDPSLPPFAYQPGQALFDAAEPGSVLARASVPTLRPDQATEQRGQVDHVCFAEGLVRFGDEWLLYFGMADSRIGLATAPAPPGG